MVRKRKFVLESPDRVGEDEGAEGDWAEIVEQGDEGNAAGVAAPSFGQDDQKDSAGSSVDFGSGSLSSPLVGGQTGSSTSVPGPGQEDYDNGSAHTSLLGGASAQSTFGLGGLAGTASSLGLGLGSSAASATASGLLPPSGIFSAGSGGPSQPATAAYTHTHAEGNAHQSVDDGTGVSPAAAGAISNVSNASASVDNDDMSMSISVEGQGQGLFIGGLAPVDNIDPVNAVDKGVDAKEMESVAGTDSGSAGSEHIPFQDEHAAISDYSRSKLAEACKAGIPSPRSAEEFLMSPDKYVNM